MTFHVLEFSIQLVSDLRGPVSRIQRQDPDLSGQIRRAATSIALNLAEGSGRAGRDRLRFYRIARGSALEVQAALRVAVAWGYLNGAVVTGPLSVLDRILAMFGGLLR